MDSIPLITGIGLVTPLADGATGTWEALLRSRFITDHARTSFDPQRPDRINIIAVEAARQALEDARWSNRPAEPGRSALVVGTSKGAIETWITPPPSTSDKVRAPAGGAACGLACVATHLRGSFSLLDGPSITLSSACASGLHALIRGAMMIRHGEADRVLIVAAEASVHPLFLASFRRLGVLPKDGVGCRPFDVNRDGFLMSEAAAAVCLESGATDIRTHAYAGVDQYAMGGDAAHLTAGDPQGETLRRLLRTVIADRQVDLIHAHGTGTTINDSIELAAIDDLAAGACRAGFPSHVYSHKGALGHSLGAAGLVSIALNGLMHRYQIIPPNVQTHDPIPTKEVTLSRKAVQRPIRRSVTIASGFGGPVAVVSIVSP